MFNKYVSEMRKKGKIITKLSVALHFNYNTWDEFEEFLERQATRARCLLYTLSIIEEELTQLLLDKTNRNHKAAWLYLSHHFGYSEADKAKKDTSKEKESVRFIVFPQKKEVGAPVDAEFEVLNSQVKQVKKAPEKQQNKLPKTSKPCPKSIETLPKNPIPRKSKKYHVKKLR